MENKIRKNLNINNKRTCVSLEDSIWGYLEDIAAAEKTSIAIICSSIAGHSSEGALTSNIRVFALNYYRFLNEMRADPSAHSLAYEKALNSNFS